ncbi:tandem-95 repeat protein [Agrobacterium tumefaciens]|nr:tandem-95 repeat protein [Agrobacterium tumefaciens]NTE26437.1 tandem-95 repeat protein [Agrobacterium tumefaciens]
MIKTLLFSHVGAWVNFIYNYLTYKFGNCFSKFIFIFFLFITFSTKLFSQFTIIENFRGSGSPQVIIGGPGGADGTAILTSGVDDPLGAGWLRLTNSTVNQRGYAYVDKSFPSTLGVLIDFEYKMWRNAANNEHNYNGGDGIAVFLFDATQPFRLGGFGGSLGYAPNIQSTPPVLDGLAGGYISVGLDAFGNYGNAIEGRNGGFGTSETANAVVVRGITTSNRTEDVVNGILPTNRFLTGVSLGDRTGTIGDIRLRNEIDYNVGTGTGNSFSDIRPTDDQFFRRVQIEIKPEAGQYRVVVRMAKSVDGSFVELINYLSPDVPPSTLKMGFAASSGGAFNYHEIRNLLVTTPGNIRVVKRANRDILQAGANTGLDYILDVINDTNAELTNVQFNDQLTDAKGNPLQNGAFTINSITPTGFISSNFTPASPNTSGSITGSFNIAANATAKIVVSGSLNTIPTGNVLNNTVNITTTDIQDEDLNNNTSVSSIPVQATGTDAIIDKTADRYCLNTSGNTTTTFTMKAGNFGSRPMENLSSTAIGNHLVITKIVPAGYTFAAGSNIGWDMSQSGSTVTYISNQMIDIPSGRYYNFPITYMLTGAGNYNDEAKIAYSNYHSASASNDIEPPENISNNTSTTRLSTPVNPIIIKSPVMYCQGTTASSLVSSVSSPPAGDTLLWYTSINGTSSTNAPIPSTSIVGNTTYYVTQTNGSCESDRVPIVVTITPALIAGTISGDQTFCTTGDPVPFTQSAPSGGSGSYSYQWQSSTTSATANFTDIAGANLAIYDAPTLDQTTYFRRLDGATGSTCDRMATNVLTVTVQSILSNNIITAPTIAAFCESGDPGIITGTVPIDGSGSYNYQWQSSLDNLNFNNISGATQISYDPGVITSTTFFRRQVTSGSCAIPTVSGVVQVTVNPLPAIYNVTGGGNYCAGTAGMVVGLSNSQTGVSYQLQIAGINTGNPVQGNGSAISFGNQTTSGIYTIAATDSNTPACIQVMNGSTTINITNKPLANTYVVTTNEDVALTGNATTTDPDGNNLIYTKATDPAHGSVTVSEAGTYIYTPGLNYNGADSFTVLVNDNVCGTSLVTVNITVVPVNDVPAFAKGSNQLVNANSGLQTVTGWATGISTGPANESAQVVDFITSNDNNALFSVQPAVSPNGSLTFTPSGNFAGRATVSMVIHDNGGTENGGIDQSLAQTFIIEVKPVGTTDNITTLANTPVLTAVKANDGETAINSMVTATNGAHGSTTVDAAGKVTYSPYSGYTGTDTYTYTLTTPDGVVSDPILVKVVIYPTVVLSGPVSVNENAGTINYTVTLAGTAGTVLASPVSVVTGIINETTNSADYTFSPQTIIFPAGTILGQPGSTINFPVGINDDGINEDDENYTITIQNLNGPATLGNAAVRTTILDNLSIIASIAAGNDGNENGVINGTFIVTLSKPSNINTEISYTLRGTAIEGADYTSVVKIVNIPAGETTAVIQIPVLGDGLIEGNETVIASLNTSTNPSVVILPVPATISIIDGTTGTVNVTATKDGAEPSTPGQFTFTLSRVSTTDTKIDFLVSGTATAGLDYTSIGSSIIIPAGETSVTLNVPVLDDNLSEGNETVILTLIAATDNPRVTAITIPAVVNIRDNRAPVASATGITTTENTPVNGVITASDIDGDVLIFNISLAPAHGTVILSNGTYVYTPAAQYTGADSFTVTVSDGKGGVATVTIPVTVTPMNVPASSSIALVKTAVLNDNQITYTFLIKNTGALTLNSVILTDTKLGINNKVIAVGGGLIPEAMVTDVAVYTITQADKDLGTVTNTAIVNAKTVDGTSVSDISGLQENNDIPTVTSFPKSPKAVDDTGVSIANASVTINLMLNDDAGSSTFVKSSIEIVSQPKNGRVVINADGTVTFTPNTGFTGSDTFTYRVKDASGYYTNIASVMITVNFTEIKIPNLFTPNGDGINDAFEIIGLNQYQSNELQIVNRWGNEVFHTKGYQNNWTGEGLNEGTYYYLLRVKKPGSNEAEVFKGYITLVRAFKN